eukprot:scaffold73918_cov72-Phaeocystis_antarctica.AAC.4
MAPSTAVRRRARVRAGGGEAGDPEFQDEGGGGVQDDSGSPTRERQAQVRPPSPVKACIRRVRPPPDCVEPAITLHMITVECTLTGLSTIVPCSCVEC